MNQEEFKYQKGKKGRGLALPRRIAYGTRAILYSPMFFTEREALLGHKQPVDNKPSRVMDDISNATNGYGLDRLSKFIQFLVRKQTTEFDKQIASLEKTATIPKSERKKIVEELRDSGFAVLPQFIPEKDAKQLYAEVLASPGRDRRTIDYSNQSEWLKDTESPRIDADRATLKSVVDQHQIDFASLQLIAREYLKCRPIQLGPNSWTTKHTPALSAEVIDENAMAFHSDSDYFDFVKAFLLLTEVDDKSGPFTFVAQSHRGNRQVQGRLKDTELGYKKEDLRFGIGRPGDLVLAVTKGWHKASIPQKGHRMMIQWLFTNTLFGSASQ